MPYDPGQNVDCDWDSVWPPDYQGQTVDWNTVVKQPKSSDWRMRVCGITHIPTSSGGHLGLGGRGEYDQRKHDLSRKEACRPRLLHKL